MAPDRPSQSNSRFLDLLAVVRAEFYHPGFGGSFSIKTVLPALVPGLAYCERDTLALVEVRRILLDRCR